MARQSGGAVEWWRKVVGGAIEWGWPGLGDVPPLAWFDWHLLLCVRVCSCASSFRDLRRGWSERSIEENVPSPCRAPRRVDAGTSSTTAASPVTRTPMEGVSVAGYGAAQCCE